MRMVTPGRYPGAWFSFTIGTGIMGSSFQRSEHPMNGYDFLQRIVAARVRQLDRFLWPLERNGLAADPPLLTPQLVAKEALTSIVVGFVRGLKADRQFVIPTFWRLDAPEAWNIRVELEKESAKLLDAAHAGKVVLYRDERLVELLGADTYWSQHLRGDVETTAVRGVLVDVLEARQKRLGPSRPGVTDDARADLCVRAFFAAMLNGLLLRGSVAIAGLGVFRDRHEPLLGFEASRQLLAAVKLRRLRDAELNTEPPRIYVDGQGDDAPPRLDEVEQSIESELAEEMARETKPGVVAAVQGLLRSLHKRAHS